MENKYKVGQALEDDIARLDNFGHINNRTGVFNFHYCRSCNGPLLGHILEEKDCKDAEMDSDVRDAMEVKIRETHMFKNMLAKMDKNKIRSKCTICNTQF